MRAHCAAACSSALRMSGRRRSISAGTLTATFAGAFGISLGPAEQCLDGARRLPEQRAQGVASLLQPDVQLGDGGPGALQQRRRLGHIELRGGTVAEARLGDPQPVLLNLTFSRASSMSTSKVRITAYVRATSAVSETRAE